MKTIKIFFVLAIALAFSSGVASASAVPKKSKPPNSPELVEKGKVTYFERCSFCHGMTGGGDGPAAEFLNPRPRNFQSNVFKFRVTESGALPTDEDLFRTISVGIQGTGMQSFDSEFVKSGLSEEERWGVIYYIQTFFNPELGFNLWDDDAAAETATDPDDKADWRYNRIMKIGDPPPHSDEIVAKGKEVFKAAKCFQCHGDRGLGNGVSANTLKDDWQFPILPRDLTKTWRFKAGTSVKDIFMRFTTGLNGTPMPSFAGTIKEEDRWAVAHYVKSINYDPNPKRELEVLKIEGALPETEDDAAWEQAKQVDVFLTGNVLIKPRWQNINIDMVHVKALFNDDEIVFRLEWHDRFKNVVHEGHNDMHQLDKTKPEEIGNLQTYVPIYSEEYKPGIYRDGVALQFPTKAVKGTRKPHFLNGDNGLSVNIWWWRADYFADSSKGNPVVEMNAKGFKKPFKIQPETSQLVTSSAKFEDGVWTLVMKRARFTEDRKDTQFEAGTFIPMAVNAWDGHNKDIGMQKSISSWYFIYLEKATPMDIYYMTLAAFLFVGGIEVFLRRKWNSNN